MGQQRQFFNPDMLMQREIMQWREEQNYRTSQKSARMYGNCEMGQLMTNSNYEQMRMMRGHGVPHNASFELQRTSLRAPPGYIMVPMPSHKSVRGGKQPRRLPNGMACLSCRLRKVRCSGTRPCLQCVCRNEACEDAPKKSVQKKNSGKKSDRKMSLKQPEEKSPVAPTSVSSASLPNTEKGRVESKKPSPLPSPPVSSGKITS